MSAMGLGCVKTSTLAAGVEASRRNCIPESQILLHTRDVMPSWRIVFSTFRGCMSFYTARVINDLCGQSRTVIVSLRPESGYKADSYPGRLETRDRFRFLGGLACEEVLQDIFAIRRGERLLANFATQQVIKRLGLRLYPYHLVVRSTLRTGEAGGIVMHRYQARSGSSHHLPLSCFSALS